MIFSNIQPKVFAEEQVEAGYTKALIKHNVPEDTDMNSRVVWRTAAGAAKPTATRFDIEYTGVPSFTLEGMTSGDSYDVSYALVDDFVMLDLALLESQYQNTANVISITTGTITMLVPASILSVTSLNNDQTQIGAPPSTVQITMEGSSSETVIEVSTDSWLTSSVIYTGAVVDGQLIDVTLSPGTYTFRTTSTFSFSDGTKEVSIPNVLVGSTSVSNSIVPPDAPTALAITATKVLDNVTSYSANLSWSWLISSGGSKQNTLVSYMEFDGVESDLSLLDWSTATSEVSLSTTHTFQGVPYRKPLAFRIQAQGWNNNASTSAYYEMFISEDTSDSSKTGYTIPVFGIDLPTNTKVQIDNQYIKGYDGTNTVTFSFDAATGNVTIGKAGMYNGISVTTPFQFDAINNILSISGQVITDQIVAADYVLGWLAGSTPKLRTANKNAYADSTEGLWMGYTDATTFKFDMGDDTQYIRWDGAKLRISGNVTIDGGSALDQVQRNSIVFIAGATTPAAPTTGSYASPIPTGWSSSIPTLLDGENAYMTQRLFTSDGLSPQDTVWTTPGLYTTGGGTPGSPGADGDTSYVHIAYATNASGTAGFSTTDPIGKTYIGQYTDFSIIDSEVPSLYLWTKTKGEAGETGKVREVRFQYSTDGLGGWHDAPILITDKYMREGTFFDGVIEAGGYSVGVVIVPDDGDSIWTQFQFSPTGLGDWSNTQRVGDIWQHSQLVTNSVGGGYGTAVKVKGSDGVPGRYFETRFAKGVTPPALSNTSPDPSGWVIDPNISTTGAEVVWATTATKLYTGALDKNWTTPIQWAGKSNVIGFLSKEAFLVPADKDGLVSSYAGATGTFNVYVGNVNVTTSSTFGVASSTAMVATINTSGVYTTSSISADVGSVNLIATYQGVSVTKVFTVAKAKQGDIGNDGERGAGVFYVEKTNANFPLTLTAARAVATAAVPDAIPVLNDRVTIVNSTVSTVDQWELSFDGANWVEYALKVHGNVLVKGTVAADRISVISGNTAVTIDPSRDEVISAYVGTKALFSVNKTTGKGVLDGLSIEDASIQPASFSEEAQDWITNAIGATSTSGGLKSFNGVSGALSGSPTQVLTSLTHVSTNPVTLKCSGNRTVVNTVINNANPDTPPTITLQLYRNGVAMSGKSVTVLGTAVSNQVGYEPGYLEYDHTYSWAATIPTFTDNPSNGNYVYSVKVTADRYDHITTVNLILSAEEQVVGAGVDLTDYLLVVDALTLGITSETAAAGDHIHSVSDITNLSGTNTGDNAANSNYSSLVSNVSTDLSYTPSTGVMASSDGNDATIPLSTTNTRGLMSTAQFDKLDGLGGGATYYGGTGLNTVGTTFSVKYSTTSTAASACQANDARLYNNRNAADVSNWAKASSKPTYTASEVGVYSWARASSKPSYTASEVGVYAWARASVKPSYTYGDVGAAPAGNYLVSGTAISVTSINVTSSIDLKNIIEREDIFDSLADVVAIGSKGVAIGSYKADETNALHNFFISEEVFAIDEKCSIDGKSVKPNDLLAKAYAAIAALEVRLSKVENK